MSVRTVSVTLKVCGCRTEGCRTCAGVDGPCGLVGGLEPVMLAIEAGRTAPEEEDTDATIVKELEALVASCRHDGPTDRVEHCRRCMPTRAAIERLKTPAPLSPFDRRAADNLADEVAVLVLRGVIDSRSLAGDALLDYRDPPCSDRARELHAKRGSPAPRVWVDGWCPRCESNCKMMFGKCSACDHHAMAYVDARRPYRADNQPDFGFAEGTVWESACASEEANHPRADAPRGLADAARVGDDLEPDPKE